MKWLIDRLIDRSNERAIRGAHPSTFSITNLWKIGWDCISSMFSRFLYSRKVGFCNQVIENLFGNQLNTNDFIFKSEFHVSCLHCVEEREQKRERERLQFCWRRRRRRHGRARRKLTLTPCVVSPHLFRGSPTPTNTSRSWSKMWSTRRWAFFHFFFFLSESHLLSSVCRTEGRAAGS